MPPPLHDVAPVRLCGDDAGMSAVGTDQPNSGGPTDLADLVDFPRETLEIELKQWIDLN